MAGLSCNITYYKESDQEESDFRKQLPLMSERGGNNGPCMGLCRGLGCVGWQHRKLQKRCAHGQLDMKQLMAELMECLTSNEMDLFWA